MHRGPEGGADGLQHLVQTSSSCKQAAWGWRTLWEVKAAPKISMTYSVLARSISKAASGSMREGNPCLSLL